MKWIQVVVKEHFHFNLDQITVIIIRLLTYNNKDKQLSTKNNTLLHLMQNGQ